MKLNDLVPPDILQQFKKTHEQSINYGKIRGNCGVVAAELCSYAATHGYNMPRVYGWFHVDNPPMDYDDFTDDEITDMKLIGFDPLLHSDRTKYATNNDLISQLQEVPHYWNNWNGNIIDLSGYYQFVVSGMASDTKAWRYTKL